MKTPKQRAQNVVKKMEDGGFIGDGIKLERESFLSMADQTWHKAGLDRSTRAECLNTLQDLMQERGHFI
tara:strand:- start:354 stop:560 length:207 start_codon:yes stop_codon:yes gene_type:complete